MHAVVSIKVYTFYIVLTLSSNATLTNLSNKQNFPFVTSEISREFAFHSAKARNLQDAKRSKLLKNLKL